MAKFCTGCGKEIETGVTFCTECGTKAPEEPSTVNAAVNTEETAKAVHTPPVQSPAPQQSYTASVQTINARPVPDAGSKVVATGAYFGMMLLFAIPIIGPLACLIMSFAPKNKNVKHFARARLIWLIIGILLFAVLVAIIVMLSNSILEHLRQLTVGQTDGLGGILEQLGGF